MQTIETLILILVILTIAIIYYILSYKLYRKKYYELHTLTEDFIKDAKLIEKESKILETKANKYNMLLKTLTKKQKNSFNNKYTYEKNKKV